MSPPLGLHPVCRGCALAAPVGCLGLGRADVRAWSWGEPDHGGCPGREVFHVGGIVERRGLAVLDEPVSRLTAAQFARLVKEGQELRRAFDVQTRGKW